MRRRFLKSIWLVTLLLVACMACVVPAFAGPESKDPNAETALPDKLGDFRASTPAVTQQNTTATTPSGILPDSINVKRAYTAANGNLYEVFLARTKNDSSAYALLTNVKETSGHDVRLGGIGTASYVEAGLIDFVKGNAFVSVVSQSQKYSQEELVNLAKALAQQLDAGENDIPVLVKHLPNWETVQPSAAYVVGPEGLKHLLPRQRVLDVISFEGGTEAVLGHYDSGTLLIVEFNTATIAKDNDWNIRSKINELVAANQGDAVPSAYRRVGNYSVFVFEAPSEQAANQLIDQVKYQQIVQWLGNDPYAYERATRQFTETTLGVFVSVVKASGLALITCLAVGGFLGALMFSRRRAQQRNVNAYSDAGAMMRLNLDELTPETDPARLLGPGMR